jgi:6-pyruvoyltetrahydropterin/6-carboxytetrahydropterin synthase
MQTISKKFDFEAAHILWNHPGKCSRLHGHSYKVNIEVTGEVMLETGFVLDFADLKNIVRPIIERFDHRCLNWFIQYPSAENIACHIAHELYGLLGLGGPKPKDSYTRLVVTVHETDGCWAKWDSQEIGALQRFDEDLDKQTGKPTYSAGWREPQVYGNIVDVPTAIAEMEYAYQHDIEQAMRHGAQLAQLKLYRDSLGKPGEAYQELMAFIGKNPAPGGDEKAQGRSNVAEERIIER